MTTPEQGQEELVEIAVAPNEIMAAVWRGWLEEEGITPMVKSAGPGMAYFSSFGNQHLLYVLASEADRAREILEEATSEEEVIEPDDL